MTRIERPDGARLEARIGIATGLVVVGELIGTGLAQERTNVGETPNLAVRLQALAAPDTILISEATQQLLGGLLAREVARIRAPSCSNTAPKPPSANSGMFQLPANANTAAPSEGSRDVISWHIRNTGCGIPAISDDATTVYNQGRPSADSGQDDDRTARFDPSRSFRYGSRFG
ncbi:MAG: adenylate/guanylate cyclase domain-containing protein [Stellaceae bacterium]